MMTKLSDIIGNRTLSRGDWIEAQKILAKAERKTWRKLLAMIESQSRE